MKILPIYIYRSNYDSEINHFYRQTRAGLICPDGFMDSENCGLKLLKIIDNPAGKQYGKIAIPVDKDGKEIIKENCNRQFGGTYVATSDSRFRKIAGLGSEAIPLHDRFERYSNK